MKPAPLSDPEFAKQMSEAHAMRLSRAQNDPAAQARAIVKAKEEVDGYTEPPDHHRRERRERMKL